MERKINNPLGGQTRPQAVPPFGPSSDVLVLRERVAHIEEDVEENRVEIRALIELAAQIRMLMSLSIGGGALSLLNLAIFFFSLVRGWG